LRLIEDFFAKTSAPACANFREVAEMISKVRSVVSGSKDVAHIRDARSASRSS